ncbi:MAG: cytochrome ubiquinol oxidase subunit I [Fibrobacteria bacterium]
MDQGIIRRKRFAWRLAALLALLCLGAAPAGGEEAVKAQKAQNAQELMKQSDCLVCHQPDHKVVGPAFKEIAAKYGTADIARLAEKVHAGGAGAWGAVPMPAHPALSIEDITTIVTWILKAHAPGAPVAQPPKVYANTKPGSEPAYRRFPVIGSRVAIWIVAQLHLMFAAFVLAVPMFALTIEYIGYRTKDRKYDHLAHEFTKLLSTSFSFTASLGAMLTFMLLILYPKLTAYLVSIFSWTFMPYVALFFAEAIFMYAYYYGWGKFHPRVHLALGVCLNLVGVAIICIADAWLTFMNSPNGITQSGELVNRWQAVHNFTWMPINVHRLIANIAFGGSIAGAYGAFKFMGAKTDEERAHYDWMGYIGNFIAISALLPLPFAGYWLGKEIYAYSQNMGMTLMGGAFSWLFIIQAVLIGTLFLAANYYLWLGMERIEGAERFRKFIKWLLGSITVCFLVWATPHSLVATVEEARKMGGAHHPALGVLGVMSAKNTAVNILILTTYVSFLLYRRGNKRSIAPWAAKGNLAQFLIFALTALFVIALGVLGYFVEAKVRIRLSVPQVASVLTAMISVTVIDIFMFRNARTTGEIRWGKMPMRSQYALILIAITFTWLMGLMGYVRSGIRQHWHVYGVMRDESVDAFTPTLGFASIVVSVTVLIFFAFISIVFWLTSLSGRKDWDTGKEAAP